MTGEARPDRERLMTSPGKRAWPSCPWPQPDRGRDASHLAARLLYSPDGIQLGDLQLDPVTSDEESDPRFRDEWLGGPRA